MNTLCFDVGGTSIKYAVFGNTDSTVYKGISETPQNREEFLRSVCDIVKSLGNNVDITKISFSFPGFINPITGFAETAGSLEYFSNLNILNEIRLVLGDTYEYYIDNDANCAAIAEKNSGHAKENESFLLLTIGTGLGGAFYINNNLIRGFQYKAGEFGRMRIQANTDIDKQSNHLISMRELISSYKLLKKIPQDNYISGKDILNDIENDEEVEDLVLQWVDNICVSIFNVSTVINPEKILIGGGVSAHHSFLSLVQERMNILNDWHEFKVPIETCKYLNDAGVMGAYYNSL